MQKSWRDIIELKVENGKLDIMPKLKNNRYNSDKLKYVRLYLTVDRLTEVKLYGSGDIEFERKFVAENLDVHLQGTGDIKFHQSLECTENLNLSLEGTGDIELERNASGKTVTVSLRGTGDIKSQGTLRSQTKMKLDIKGSGDVELNEMKAYNAEISLAGTGNLEVENAQLTTLKAELKGSGNMELKGSVQAADYTVQGTGCIRAEQLRTKRAKVLMQGPCSLRCHVDELLEGEVRNNAVPEYNGKANVEVTAQRGRVKRL